MLVTKVSTLLSDLLRAHISQTHLLADASAQVFMQLLVQLLMYSVQTAHKQLTIVASTQKTDLCWQRYPRVGWTLQQ